MFRRLLFSIVSSAALLAATPRPQPFRHPLVFEPNRGQAPAQVKWLAHGSGYQLLLTSGGLTISVPEKAGRQYRTVQMKLTGGRPWNQLTGLDPTGGVSNYLRGRKAQNSVTDIPHYARLSVAGVYEGVDLVLYGNGGDLEYDFVVAPGADPTSIQWAFTGQDQLAVDGKSGDLLLTAGEPELRQLRPKVYQQIGNKRVAVDGGYELTEGGRAAFRVASYDHRRPLVIDPAINFIKFLSGSKGERANAIAVDSGGNSYITGFTTSENFPIQQALEPSFHKCDSGFGGFCGPGTDAFVTKLSADGAIVFSTYLGGNDGDIGNGIAVDTTGIFIAGYTFSGDFPNKVPGAIDDTRFGGRDAFVTKLSPDGSQLIYSRIISGSGDETANAIAVDSQHAVWVTGNATAGRILVGAPGHQSYTSVHGPSDMFYAKFGATGNDLFRGLAGGSSDDAGAGVAVDRDNNPWFTGQTCSPDFPASPGFSNLRGRCGVFVLRLTNQPQLGTTKFATVFGGSQTGDSGSAIVVNANREAFVTGYTSSPLFPVMSGGYQTYQVWAGAEAFVTKLDTFGHFVYSTLLGTDGDTQATAIALNGAGQLYVAGYTAGTSFPGNGPLTPDPTAGFLSKFSPDLRTLLYSRQIGSAIYGVAAFENVPGVTPSLIHTAGLEASWTNGDAMVGKLTDDLEYARLCNYWKPNQCINIESGVAATSAVGPGWLSAQWQFVLQPPTNGDPVGASVFWIQNRWKPDQYLNMESGKIQSSAVGAGWLSARWTFELVAGTNLHRIRSAWQPSLYLNIESGALAATAIQPGWLSAQWTFNRVF